jgi:hypothetical protein
MKLAKACHISIDINEIKHEKIYLFFFKISLRNIFLFENVTTTPITPPKTPPHTMRSSGSPHHIFSYHFKQTF